MFEWYWVFLFYLFLLHIRAVVITVYLHRGVVHKTLEVSNTAEKIFTFLTWITGLYFDNYKKVYCAQHRKHHATSDTTDDPHSPYHYNVLQMIDIYHNEPGRPYYISNEDFAKYAGDVKQNITSIDRNLYIPYYNRGIWIWFPIIFWLYGPIATLISVVSLKYILNEFYMLIANYGYHKFGYRAKEGNKFKHDKSKNFLPIAILFAGEELHANHHNFPASPKFSRQWFEFDLGWLYIKILEKFKLVHLRY